MKTLLGLNDTTTHKISKVKDNIKEYETTLIVKQSGLTWRLEQLEIGINKVFKENLRGKYVD